MKVVVNLNGRIHASSDVFIPIFDHGFLYGDSVYETLITYQGKPFYLKEHLDRLYQSASAIYIKPTWSKNRYTQEIKKTLQPLIKQKKDALIRITLTRGVGPIGLDPKLCKKPTNIIMAQELKTYSNSLYTQGVHLWIVERQRNAPRALNPAVKTCNFLNNVLAYIEAQNHKAYDGVMLNSKGLVAEGTTFNIFIVKNNVLKTPRLETGILPGITRHIVCTLAAKNGLKVLESDLKPRDVYGSDECFMTSTTKEVMGVTRCNNKKIASGKVGPLTQRLLQLYRGHVYKVLSLH